MLEPNLNECLIFCLFTYSISMSLSWKKMHSDQPRSNWTLENGYDLSKDKKAYPYRVFVADAEFSLEIILRTNANDLDHLCCAGLHGFKVMLLEPSESFQKLRKYFLVAPGRSATCTVTPKLTITSDNVRKYEPGARGCYFSSERHLRFFRHYTQNNCEMECLSNFTLAQCGCVLFSMPSKDGINSLQFDSKLNLN